MSIKSEPVYSWPRYLSIWLLIPIISAVIVDYDPIHYYLFSPYFFLYIFSFLSHAIRSLNVISLERKKEKSFLIHFSSASFYAASSCCPSSASCCSVGGGIFVVDRLVIAACCCGKQDKDGTRCCWITTAKSENESRTSKWTDLCAF